MSAIFDTHLSFNIYTLAQFAIYCGAGALALFILSRIEIKEREDIK